MCEIEGLGRQTLGFPVALIAEAKLMLTDALVREALRAAKGKPPLDEKTRIANEPARARAAVEKTGKKAGRRAARPSDETDED